MVNYRAIADAAESYSDYKSAFEALSEMHEVEYKELSSNELRKWAAFYGDDYQAIKGSSDTLGEMAVAQINIDTSTMNVGDPAVRQFIDGLPISPEGKAALLGMAIYSRSVWPGLKPGHVQNALQKRAEGVI